MGPSSEKRLAEMKLEMEFLGELQSVMERSMNALMRANAPDLPEGERVALAEWLSKERDALVLAARELELGWAIVSAEISLREISQHGRSAEPTGEACRLAAQRQAAGWHTLYAAVKVAMEQEVLRAHQAGLPAVIVNPSLCLGEYDAHPFSGRAILAFARYRLPVYIESTFNAIYTGDVGVGHVRAAERGRLGERYLLAHRNLTVKEFATLVAKAAGVPPPRWRLPYRLAVTAALAAEGLGWLTRTEPLLSRGVVESAGMGQPLDGTKAREELGFPQTPIEEAVARALGYFKARGYL